MAKDKLTDYDATAASNTDVGGINIQGSAAISNGDNAIREVMSHLAETNAGTYPVADTWTFGDPADLTKRARIDAGGVTAGQTRVLTAPDFNGTIATLAGTETLTNKTLTTPTLTLKQGTGPTPTAEGDIQWDTDDNVLVIGDGSASKTIAPVTTATAQASTSGDTITFSSIPAWVKQITVTFVGVSVSGTANPAIRIGDSGGLELTGYSSSSSLLATSSVSSSSSTTGFHINGAAASNTLSGSVTLTLADAATFTWVAAGVLGTSTNTLTVCGSKALSAALDRVAVQTGGADTFDAGSINITYH